MNAELKDALIKCETDVDAVMKRLSGDEKLYDQCLAMFLTDPAMEELTRAIGDRSWDDAFTAVHAIKGVAGNMGFIPLFHASAELIILIRTGKVKEVDAALEKLKRSYNKIYEVISRYFTTPAGNE